MDFSNYVPIKPIRSGEGLNFTVTLDVDPNFDMSGKTVTLEIVTYNEDIFQLDGIVVGQTVTFSMSPGTIGSGTIPFGALLPQRHKSNIDCGDEWRIQADWEVVNAHGCAPYGDAVNVDVTVAESVNITVQFNQGGGGGSQTPWLSDIDGGGFSLTNVNAVVANTFNGVALTAAGVGDKLLDDAGVYANTQTRGILDLAVDDQLSTLTEELTPGAGHKLLVEIPGTGAKRWTDIANLPGGGGGSQTPWLQDVDAAEFDLFNLKELRGRGTAPLTIDSAGNTNLVLSRNGVPQLTFLATGASFSTGVAVSGTVNAQGLISPFVDALGTNLLLRVDGQDRLRATPTDIDALVNLDLNGNDILATNLVEGDNLKLNVPVGSGRAQVAGDNIFQWRANDLFVQKPIATPPDTNLTLSPQGTGIVEITTAATAVSFNGVALTDTGAGDKLLDDSGVYADTATRGIIDLNELDQFTGVAELLLPGPGDKVLVEGSAAGAKRYVDFANFPTGGDVSGPASSTDDHVTLFDGTTGKLIKDSGIGIASVINLVTNSQFGGVPEETNPLALDRILIEKTATGAKQWIQVGNLPTGGGGEANLGANIGGGVGEVFRDKTGITLNFKTLRSSDGSVTITNEADTINLQSSSGGGSPLTTKGDLYTFSTVDARLPVGTDGQVLSADSAEPTGLKWVAAGGGGGSPGGSVNDLQIHGAGNVFAGGGPTWDSPNTRLNVNGDITGPLDVLSLRNGANRQELRIYRDDDGAGNDTSARHYFDGNNYVIDAIRMGAGANTSVIMRARGTTVLTMTNAIAQFNQSVTGPDFNGVALTDGGPGTNVLHDDGAYKPAGGGGPPTENPPKWTYVLTAQDITDIAAGSVTIGSFAGVINNPGNINFFMKGLKVYEGNDFTSFDDTTGTFVFPTSENNAATEGDIWEISG